MCPVFYFPSRWRHNGRDSVSNHQLRHCLLRLLFRRRSKKASKLRVTGLCAGIHRGPVNSPHMWPVTRKMFPFDDVIMPLTVSFSCLFQIRVGMPGTHAYGPEQLLYKYGVDLHFQAHEHSYERMWPVYNNTVCEIQGVSGPQEYRPSVCPKSVLNWNHVHPSPSF